MALGRTSVIALMALVAVAAPGVAGAAWTGPFARTASNPADRLAALPIEAGGYDRAEGCTRRTAAPGALALASWLGRTTAGTSWGVVRCERWGAGSASLHAEGRAVDWRLDAGRPAERRAARRLIALLLAPDRKGRPAALARRMGVQEIIFDCRGWFGGAPALGPYARCRAKGVDRTTAHRDHVHLGLTKDGAAKRTSFWTRRAPAPDKRERWTPPPPLDLLPD
ncbi:MAG TPA: hypothetical protein VD931_15645 [Baekduia sp.]|nr:hypothetical protein [Baekduia sp.]